MALLVGQFFMPSHTFEGTTGLRALVGTWDAGIFLAIADDGYPLGPDQDPFRAAFFPGWPLAERTLGWPLSALTDPEAARLIAGVVLTTVCSLGAAFLVHRIAYEQFGRKAAGWAVVMLMAWPSAAFLTALYSESLYLVAAMAAWWLATQRRWVLAGLVCGAASFIRITGVFLCIALVVMYVTTIARGRERVRWADLGGVLLGGWGIVAYFAYLFGQTGDVLAWSHAQVDGWGRASVAPWSALASTLTMMTSTELDNADWRWQMAADLLIVAVCFALAVVMLRRRYWPELTLTLLTLGTVLTSTSYISVTRYTLSIFPLMVLSGSLLARLPPRGAVVIVGLSTAWMSAVMGLFALGFWAG